MVHKKSQDGEYIPGRKREYLTHWNFVGSLNPLDQYVDKKKKVSEPNRLNADYSLHQFPPR